MIKPRALRKGDVVGIIAPSAPPFEPGDLEFTYRWLKKLGLGWKLGKHVFDSHSDLGGSDQARLEDLHSMWADPEVNAILPVRGGNGAVRLLPMLDFDLIAQHPKIIIGFSDITGLIIPIHQRTGLITFHGPTAGSFYDSSYTYSYFTRALMETRPLGTVRDPSSKSQWNPEYPPYRLVIAEGRGTGRLTGGCLTLIRQLMGTAFEIETEGRILFLEDVAEEPYSIDRMLSQLLLAGKLKQCTGIVVGDCVRCRPGMSGRNVLPLSYSIEEVLRERLGGLGIPVIYGPRLGHGTDKLTLPLGVMASLDVTRKAARFRIKESGVT